MKKKIDINELIWIIILIAFTYYFYKLVYTGKLVYFIHPKMFKYIYFSIIVMALMIVYQLSNLFKNSSKGTVKVGYLLFLFIIFIGLVIDPEGLNAQAAVNRGIKIGDKVFDVSKNNKGNPDKNGPIKRRPGGAVQVNEENYISIMNDINSNIDEYKGSTITVNGFIYKEDSLGKDKFVIARMMVSCCAADAQVIGYLCRYNGKEKLSKNQWVKITGIINEDIIEDKGKKRVPMIEIGSIERIDAPVNKYVYD